MRVSDVRRNLIVNERLTMTIYVLTAVFMIGGELTPPAYVATFATEAICESAKAQLLAAKPDRRMVCEEDRVHGK